MQIQEFRVGDPIQWLQQFEEIDYPIRGVVEIVGQEFLTVRDNLGNFWQVTDLDEPTKVWD
jgi:hypothetical protein